MGHNGINKIIIYTSNFHIKYPMISSLVLGTRRIVPYQPRIPVIVNDFPMDTLRGERSTRISETA